MRYNSKLRLLYKEYIKSKNATSKRDFESFAKQLDPEVTFSKSTYHRIKQENPKQEERLPVDKVIDLMRSLRKILSYSTREDLIELINVFGKEP